MKERLSFQEPEADEATINLTPLIDVVFIVLIMFIIIAPLIEIDRINLAAGKPIKKHAPLNQKPIQISVQKDNTILVNKQRVLDLEKTLQELHQLHAEATPQVFHDKEASFGTYQRVKNALEHAGFEQMDIILKND